MDFFLQTLKLSRFVMTYLNIINEKIFHSSNIGLFFQKHVSNQVMTCHSHIWGESESDTP